jgi:excisionase family DNA binding protein
MTVARALVIELARDPEALDELRELLQVADQERLLTVREAADRLGIHYRTLLEANRAGRVLGAVPVGKRGWRFRASDLELLPPVGRTLTAAGPGRGGGRVPGHSSAVRSIRGAA